MVKVLDIQVKQKVKVMNDNPTAWDHMKQMRDSLKPIGETIKKRALAPKQ